MRIEVTTEGNRLILPMGLRVRSTRPKVIVEIPDEAVEMLEPGRSGQSTAASYAVSPEVRTRAEAMLNELAAIRAQDADESGPLPEWTEEREERWEAFELRSRLRKEEGRPE